MPRSVRKARNQALFREVNEQIAALASESNSPEPLQAFICECQQLGCSKLIELPLDVYELIRDEPNCYVVTRGHQDPEGRETVVSDQGGYLVVRVDAAGPS